MKEKIKLKHHIFHLMEELKDEESIISFATFVGGRDVEIKEVNPITYISIETVDNPTFFLLMFSNITIDGKLLIPQAELNDFEVKLNDLKNDAENVKGYVCVKHGDLIKSFTIEEIMGNAKNFN